MSLASLPAELYTAILYQLDPSFWTQTLLSLSRVLPYAPIPIYLLFHSIYIKHPQQAILFYLRLRRTSKEYVGPASDVSSITDPCASWVKEFSLQSWSVDAEVIINTIRLLPNLKVLNLRIGPKYFSPEHLENLLKEPICRLEQLSLRFRPYVEKASYYQFHKGVYFDSAFLAIAKWPPQNLPVISIIQDSQDTITEHRRRSFAQPIVFFLLDPNLSLMLHSPAIAHRLKALRVRLPSRAVTRALCLLPSETDFYHSDVQPTAPNLEILDLSTCAVMEGELDMILACYRNLQHLILDGCVITRTEHRHSEWSTFGKRCALVGVKRAREREREVKAWQEERWEEDNGTSPDNDVLPAQVVMSTGRPNPRRQRSGRRGLAVATISLRSRSPDDHVTRVEGDPNSPKMATKKIRILPFIPKLKTLTTTTNLEADSARHATIRAEFEAGWAEGIAQLAVTRDRLRRSSKPDVRLMQFVDDVEHRKHGRLTAGLEGLRDVDANDDDAFQIYGERAPILCLAGPRKNGDHVPGCGHSIGWETWMETGE